MTNPGYGTAPITDEARPERQKLSPAAKRFTEPSAGCFQDVFRQLRLA
jgi:hypothetical protein